MTKFFYLTLFSIQSIVKRSIIILVFLVLATTNAQTIEDDLLLHYNFNNNLLDVSGNNNNPTNFGAVFTADRDGNTNGAILFDGIDDYLELPNITSLKPQLPVSFSFWIRYDSDNPNDRDVFNTSFEDDVNTGIFFNSQQSTGNFAINYGDGSNSYTYSTRRTYVSNHAINTGEWKHVAIVVSGENNMQIYVDCVEYGGVYSGSGGDLSYSNLSGVIGK